VLISVLENAARDTQCVVVGQLQQEPSIVIKVSIRMLTDHILLDTRVVYNVCQEVSQKDRGFLSITFRRASLVSSNNAAHCSVEFRPLIFIKHRSSLSISTSTWTPFLTVGSIH